MDYTDLFHIVGFFLIWFAVYYNRSDKSKLMIFTKDWFIVFLLILIGGLLVRS